MLDFERNGSWTIRSQIVQILESICFKMVVFI